jgi:hypothetical protein
LSIAHLKFEIPNPSAPPLRPLRLCVELNPRHAQAPITTPQAATSKPAAPLFFKAVLSLLLLLVAAVIAQAQAADAARASDELVVAGNPASDVFGLGRAVRVRGEVRNGVLAFGGDVIVEGKVNGDVAAIGGSVIQLDGSYIGGDVMVIGGEYRRGQAAARNLDGRTMMVAGYEQELRSLARNPASILTPELTLSFLGWRLLAVLFWFVVSIALTAVSPGAVSRAAARLHLTLARVALIGLLGAVVMGPGVVGALEYLPTALGALAGVTALLLLLLSYLFGRVVIHAVTGRWLQRALLPEKKRSESVALLLGAVFWAVLLSLPYVWPFLVVALVVTSLGLALTARYRLNFRRA